MVNFLVFSNIEYWLGGAGGLVILFLFIWVLLRNSGNDRIGIENREIRRDKELLELHMEARNEEKEERTDAERLLSLFSQLYGAALSLKIHNRQLDVVVGVIIRSWSEPH